MGLTAGKTDVAPRAAATKPPVSIVIPTHDGLGVLAPCLESLGALHYPEAEVVLVDNASRDGTAEYVAEHFPAVRLVRLGRNAGFAGGINAGIARAAGDYVFLLNNDTAVAPDALDALVDFMEAHPEAGLVGPKIVSYDDPTRVDSLGLATYPDGVTRGLGRGEPAYRHAEAREVLFPSGCACLCRRAVLEQVGLLDEDFHLLLEDADLGWRTRMAGWKCYCVPSAVVRHRYSATIGPYSPRKAYFVERNRIWLAVKNFPMRQLCMCPYYSLVRYIHQAASVLRGEGASAHFYRRHGPLVLAWTLVRAYAAAAWGLPTMFRKRRALAPSRRATPAQVREWFDRFGISARDLARTA